MFQNHAQKLAVTSKLMPNKEQLISDISEMPMTHVGKKYKVSDNSIRKWCKKLEIDYKAIKI